MRYKLLIYLNFGCRELTNRAVTCHYISMPICQFAKLTICQVATLSICQFDHLTICPFDSLSSTKIVLSILGVALTTTRTSNVLFDFWTIPSRLDGYFCACCVLSSKIMSLSGDMYMMSSSRFKSMTGPPRSRDGRE